MVKGLFWAGKLMLKPAHRVALSCSLLPIWLLINGRMRCLSEKPLEAARQASSTESVSEGGRPSLGAKFFPPIISLPPSPPAEVAGLAVSTSYLAPVANKFHSAPRSWRTIRLVRMSSSGACRGWSLSLFQARRLLRALVAQVNPP
jgi:hypothetical protein